MIEVEEKQVLELLEKVEKGMKSHEEICKLFDEAIRMIPRWIPVSERLPEVGTGNVLVARSYKGKPYVDVGEFINGTAFCWGDEYAINPREHITTHWMPLPEPPKENADEVH